MSGDDMGINPGPDAPYGQLYESVIQHSQRTGRTDYVVCAACGSGVLDKKVHNRFHAAMNRVTENKTAEDAEQEQAKKFDTWIMDRFANAIAGHQEPVETPQRVQSKDYAQRVHSSDYVIRLETEYAKALKRLRRYSGSLLEEYRMQAELEDLQDGCWDGPRTDLAEVPEGWA